ncbi:hypothetical protein [Chitinophaga tropicalis]|nr:hypothetical protein [Chitinophaga tropicalis]
MNDCYHPEFNLRAKKISFKAGRRSSHKETAFTSGESRFFVQFPAI